MNKPKIDQETLPDEYKGMSKTTVIAQGFYPLLHTYHNACFPGSDFKRSLHTSRFTVAIFKIKPRPAINAGGQLNIAA